MFARLSSLALAALLVAGCAVSPGGPPRLALDQGEGVRATPAGGARTGHRAAIESPVDQVPDRMSRPLRISAAALPVSPAPGAPDAPLDDPLTCLARTVYFESRGRDEREQTAVAWVVLNRAAASNYPDDVCAVVKQGGHARPCQFSWFCDGRPDVARHRSEYAQSLRVAQKVLAGGVEDPTNGANMFHNTRVRPYWTAEARNMGRIGAHVFWQL